MHMLAHDTRTKNDMMARNLCENDYFFDLFLGLA